MGSLTRIIRQQMEVLILPLDLMPKLILKERIITQKLCGFPHKLWKNFAPTTLKTSLLIIPKNGVMDNANYDSRKCNNDPGPNKESDLLQVLKTFYQQKQCLWDWTTESETFSPILPCIAVFLILYFSISSLNVPVHKNYVQHVI